jgi:hypothetical protein
MQTPAPAPPPRHQRSAPPRSRMSAACPGMVRTPRITVQSPGALALPPINSAAISASPIPPIAAAMPFSPPLQFLAHHHGLAPHPQRRLTLHGPTPPRASLAPRRAFCHCRPWPNHSRSPWLTASRRCDGEPRSCQIPSLTTPPTPSREPRPPRSVRMLYRTATMPSTSTRTMAPGSIPHHSRAVEPTTSVCPEPRVRP